MMMNIDLDTQCWWIRTAERPKPPRAGVYDADILKGNMGTTIDLFGGEVIKRQSLHIRIWSCCTELLEGTTFTNFCQQLKAFSSFRTVVVDVFPAFLMDEYPYQNNLDIAEKAIILRNLVERITLEVVRQLEPAFGPAVSGFKSVSGNERIARSSVLSLGDTILVGFVEFHPDEHSKKKLKGGKAQLQRGAQGSN